MQMIINMIEKNMFNHHVMSCHVICDIIDKHIHPKTQKRMKGQQSVPDAGLGRCTQQQQQAYYEQHRKSILTTTLHSPFRHDTWTEPFPWPPTHPSHPSLPITSHPI